MYAPMLLMCFSNCALGVYSRMYLTKHLRRGEKNNFILLQPFTISRKLLIFRDKGRFEPHVKDKSAGINWCSKDNYLPLGTI